MKIGILTASRTNNNGTDLQAYAMCEIFKKYYDSVEIINYVCPKIESSYKILFSPFTIKKIIKLPIEIYRDIDHKIFRRKYIQKSKKMNILDLKKYDMVVVGSDQIWNLELTGYDLNFYLNNQKKIIKNSYAVSFGKNNLLEWNNKYKIFNMLQEFNNISVREESSLLELEKNNLVARNDLDPLLMLDKKEWETLIEYDHRDKKFIFFYMVEDNKFADKIAREYSKKLNLKVIYYNIGIKNKRGFVSKRFISLKKWLYYVKNASLIITNSYHCMSFGTLFNKSMCIFKLNNNIGSNIRLIDFINKYYDVPIYNNMIDLSNVKTWKTINDKIYKERINSYNYVRSMNTEIIEYGKSKKNIRKI